MNTAIARGGLGSIVFFAIFAMLPAFASAATSPVAVRTTQLLPTGAQTCVQMSVTSVTPYVYDGALHSFDIVMQDSSYVAIGGSVGNEVVPFRLMTRSMAQNGQMKIHTDVDSTMVGQGLPVSVTLLSAQGGKVCASMVAFSVLPDSAYPTTPTITPINGGGSTSGGPSSQGSSNGGAAAPVVKSPTTSAPTTTVAGGDAGARICSGSGALWLWLVLLLAYAAIAALAAISRTPFLERSPAIPVAMILVPLILLVGFWYFSPDCRGASWVPIALLIIAIAGLLGAFHEQKGGPLMLLTTPPKPIPMPPAKPQTPVTQMPAQKSVDSMHINPHVQKIQEKLREILKQK